MAGGIIDSGETPRECAVRELFEETNQSVKSLSLLAC
ncbi:NUDIX hydrolase [Gracilibacillus oryzae]|nr:NUDIX hydrolase [Gracilibacillus oryzae]